MTLRGDDWFGLAVWTIAFSADGKFLASGHNLDRTIKIWDLDKGKQIRTLRGHYSAVCAVTFNPLDRSIISSGFDGTIKIWNWENGQGFHTLYGPSSWLNSVKYWWLNRDESIYAMTLSSDGQILASGGSQDWINIWSLGNRQLHNTLKGHSDSVQCVAIAPNGKILASGSDDKTIKIWDITTGTLLHTLGHADRVNTVAFGPDGQTLISGSQDKTIKIWRLMRLMSNEF
jgi:WD40 repeat protein